MQRLPLRPIASVIIHAKSELKTLIQTRNSIGALQCNALANWESANRIGEGYLTLCGGKLSLE